jgi:hypothetical protein
MKTTSTCTRCGNPTERDGVWPIVVDGDRVSGCLDCWKDDAARELDEMTQQWGCPQITHTHSGMTRDGYMNRLAFVACLPALVVVTLADNLREYVADLWCMWQTTSGEHERESKHIDVQA